MNVPLDIPNYKDVWRTTDYIAGEWAHSSRIQTFDYLHRYTINHIVDIGANIGIFTEICLQRFPGVLIDCIEPHRDNCALLERFFGSLPNVNIHEYAIFYGLGTDQMTSRNPVNEPLNTGGYILSCVPDEHLGKFKDKLYTHPNLVFSVRTLEDILTSIPDVIKIDIEGAEYNVIANSSIFRKAKFLLIEFHNHNETFCREFLQQELPTFKIIIFSSGSYQDDGHNYYVFLENQL